MREREWVIDSLPSASVVLPSPCLAHTVFYGTYLAPSATLSLLRKLKGGYPEKDLGPYHHSDWVRGKLRDPT